MVCLQCIAGGNNNAQRLLPLLLFLLLELLLLALPAVGARWRHTPAKIE